MKEGARIGKQYARRLIYVLAVVWLVVAVCIGLIAYWTPALQGGVCVLLFLLLCVGFAGSAVGVHWISRRYAAQMVERIDFAYQSEKAFISNASHELNNPLTAIQGECEITLMKERSVEEYQDALRRIAMENYRIIQLIKQLLFLARGDREQLQNAVDTFSLADYLMQFSSARITFSPDNFAYQVDANPDLLKIALQNILNNACKYSGDKPVEMRLRGSVLSIEDRGIGIPPEEIKRVTQPFYRASNAHAYAGRGIGLSLSLRILRKYGASVQITSRLGEGTTISIDFEGDDRTP